MSFSCQKMNYQKAFRVKQKMIKRAEDNVAEQGLEYLRNVRYATFICLRYGEDSFAYAKSLKATKKSLGRYMKALESCYKAINFDIKELME